MTMVYPREICVGSLSHAPAAGLTLLLPRTKYEETMLVAGVETRKIAVFLGAQFRLEAFECSTNDALKGMLIPGVSIELDDESRFNPADGDSPTLGCLIREGVVLSIFATVKDGPHGFKRAQRVALISGLPACAEREAVAFRKWRIVIGEDEDKRELLAMDCPAPKPKA
ncbi:MAG: hypothetical protein QOH47_971 [Sphingomonadales bacterium]|jgi:hypothetical protein|nr:hypothetical protein [Sphingomonadales bacterium]